MILKLISLFTSSLHACSVCGFGDDGTKWGYIITTGVMTFIPLGLLAFGVYYVRKKVKKVEDEQEKNNI